MAGNQERLASGNRLVLSGGVLHRKTTSKIQFDLNFSLIPLHSAQLAVVRPQRRSDDECSFVKLLAVPLMIAVTVMALTLPALAQETESEEATHVENTRAGEAKLAEEFNDPLTTLPQLFVQDAYTPVNYGVDAPANRVIVRLIVPRIPRFSWSPFIQLIRPTFSLVTVPTGRGSDTRTAFGDMGLIDLFVIPWLPRA